MRVEELFQYTFKSLRQRLGIRESFSGSLVDRMRSDDNALCRQIRAEGLLTESQLLAAAERYRLGRSRHDGTVLWMIDEHGVVRDGRVVFYADSSRPSQWVSSLLREQFRDCPETYAMACRWQPQRCLFGLQQLGAPYPASPEGEGKHHGAPPPRGRLGGGLPICIVDSERTTVVLSELRPEAIWMASQADYLQAAMLAPLKGHRVVLYPRTDLTGDSFLAYLELADEARRAYQLDITVSSLLEDRCTDDQKERGIDVLDFLFEK